MQLPPRYALGRELGRGGMGIVYEAEDDRLGRRVAIKILQTGPGSAERRRRFAQEARAASALNHPNIITIYDIDAADEGDFIVMELVDGKPLTQLIREGPLPVDRAVAYATQVASALAVSHAADIVHRDMKPANVMVTRDGLIKVLDFGLSKWTTGDAPAPEAATAIAAPHTTAGAIVGTSGYMSPEQALGLPVDARSDVFSFGVVLYELLAGARAFGTASDLSAIQGLLHDPHRPLKDIRADVPDALVRIVDRCLEKERERRYPSAVELLEDLKKLTPAAAPQRSQAARYVAAAAVAALAAVVAATWVVVRRSQTAAMIERSIPEIDRLTSAGQYLDAYLLAERVAREKPGDARVQRARAAATMPITLKEPAGADLYFRSYTGKGAPWQLLGRIPIPDDRRAPLGELQWKLVKAGFDTAEGSSPIQPFITLRPAGETPPGMVFVPGGPVQYEGAAVTLPEFWLDKYEVTNREFKGFVDAGGYRDARYWKDAGGFAIVDGFRDKTGRPGPATWELGVFPDGQGDYPVSGVSWYEAAAYAAFAGKRLPTMFHWRRAVGNVLFGHVVVSMANFNGKSVEPVTALADLGAFGTYGLAGNVKEWIWNATDERRSVVGGAYSDPAYLAFNREARLPVDRNVTHGFRCMRDGASPTPADALAERPFRAVARSDKPVGDDLYAAYKALYAYDRTPLDAKVEPAGETEYWRAELVTIAAAYGHERVPVYLLLPRNAAPPYQPVVWFPGGYAFGPLPISGDLSGAPGAAFLTFMPRIGRALVFPIYQGLFQRFGGVPEFPREHQMNAYRDVVIQRSKDLGRTIDYLETRPDIDATKLGYYGLSAGANGALPLIAVESRFKAVVLISGGLPAFPRPPEAEPLNFAPRITAPTLMINGRDDFIFPLETTARPLFTLLGAPPDRKRFVINDGGGHVPPLNDMVRDVVEWFDRYLGPVTTR